MVGLRFLVPCILVRVQVPQLGASASSCGEKVICITFVLDEKRLSLSHGAKRVPYETCTVHVMEEMRSGPSPAAVM